MWRGYDERLSRPVAIKLLDASQARWVRSEASSLAKLAHAHIATVYDYGNTATGYYIVLEFVEGRSLADALEVGPLPWSVAVRYCAEVADALAAAHRRGLVHRDVSPGNIMLTSSGVKLIDFGLSVLEGESETDSNGEARGTPPYVAPERLTGTAVTPASDVFGLAVVLYRAIAGQSPWLAGTVPELLSLQATTDPDPLPAIAGLPDAVARACLRSLSRDPDDRPTAAQLANLLGDATQARPVETVPSEPATDPAVVTHSLRRMAGANRPYHRGDPARAPVGHRGLCGGAAGSVRLGADRLGTGRLIGHLLAGEPGRTRTVPSPCASSPTSSHRVRGNRSPPRSPSRTPEHRSPPDGGCPT